VNEEALAEWEMSRQKHTLVAILINLTLLLLEILPLATANLAKERCLGLHAASTVLTNVLKVTSCQDPLWFFRGADKSLTRPTSRYILFDSENISFDAGLVIYIYIYIYIYMCVCVYLCIVLIFLQL
jgi:hypothetical protein